MVSMKLTDERTREVRLSHAPPTRAARVLICHTLTTQVTRPMHLFVIVTRTSHIPTVAAESHEAVDKISSDIQHRIVHLPQLILTCPFRFLLGQVKKENQGRTGMNDAGWF